MSEVTLDASALLAVFNGEPGSERVAAFLTGGECTMSTVNLSEVVTKLVERGVTLDEAQRAITAARLTFHPFDEAAAFEAASLRMLTRPAGLSFGDRACVALAARLGAVVVTTDRSWVTAGLPVEVILARPD